MKPDRLEERLSNTPPRQVPANWRDQILQAAREPQRAATPPSCLPTLRELDTLRSALRRLLWPSPRAWAVLATLWVGILAVHLAEQRNSIPYGPGDRVVPALASRLKESEQLLSELINQPQAAPVKPSPVPPPPASRSERRGEFFET